MARCFATEKKKCLLIGRRGAIATVSLMAREAGGRQAVEASLLSRGQGNPPEPQGRRESAKSPGLSELRLEASPAAGS